MPDVMSRVNGSLIQHGKAGDRIYLMKLSEVGVQETIERLDWLAEAKGYTKIVAKVPEGVWPEFERRGYVTEAIVPRFYNGEDNVFFMGKFFSDERETEENLVAIQSVLSEALKRTGECGECRLEEEFTWDVAEESDAEAISSIYRAVFATYPFPIHDPLYIKDTMRDNVVYFCIRRDGEVVSVASSEMDRGALNVEMTDFATLPEYRKNGFATFLLERMEAEMRARGIKTSYTIARAVSYGMNITFAKMDYRFAGTLIKNTDICGHTESMNIWYKGLENHKAQ